MVTTTVEGEVLWPDLPRPPRGKARRGFPLTKEGVDEMLTSEQLTEAVRLLVEQTWHHREFLGLTAG